MRNKFRQNSSPQDTECFQKRIFLKMKSEIKQSVRKMEENPSEMKRLSRIESQEVKIRQFGARSRCAPNFSSKKVNPMSKQLKRSHTEIKDAVSSFLVGPPLTTTALKKK